MEKATEYIDASPATCIAFSVGVLWLRAEYEYWTNASIGMGAFPVRDTDQFLNFLINHAVGDGAIVIAPHKDPFRSRQRNFLDGIRNVPASISAPPGQNPFTEILAKDGRWMFVWIPER